VRAIDANDERGGYEAADDREAARYEQRDYSAAKGRRVGKYEPNDETGSCANRHSCADEPAEARGVADHGVECDAVELVDGGGVRGKALE